MGSIPTGARFNAHVLPRMLWNFIVLHTAHVLPVISLCCNGTGLEKQNATSLLFVGLLFIRAPPSGLDIMLDELQHRGDIPSMFPVASFESPRMH
jgi:hypothetical protein